MSRRKNKSTIYRFVRGLHSWLGLLLLPWIFLAGFTGFYLNHSELVFNVLRGTPYDEEQIDLWPSGVALTEADAQLVAERVWPEEAITDVKSETYHGRDAVIFRKESGNIIVAIETGHYWTRTKYVRQTFAPNGENLDKKVYWGFIFKRLHTTGWLDSKMGTVFADVAAVALMMFSVSGIWIFFRRRNSKPVPKRSAFFLKPSLRRTKDVLRPRGGSGGSGSGSGSWSGSGSGSGYSIVDVASGSSGSAGSAAMAGPVGMLDALELTDKDRARRKKRRKKKRKRAAIEGGLDGSG